MRTTGLDASGKLALPFVGRGKELTRLSALHAEGRHVLILGPAGVGKTALIAHLAPKLNLLLCPRSERLSDICAALEPAFGLEAEALPLVQRKNRLLARLGDRAHTIVFDGVNWTTPKLSRFIENVSERALVWIAGRSEHPWDIGHVWPLLGRFERVWLAPLRPAETRALVIAAVERGVVPAATQRFVAWLHRRSGGLPRALYRLLEELATGQYDLEKPQDRRLLDLDRRIHDLFPAPTSPQSPSDRVS